MFGEIKRPDSTQPLHLQGDQLIYDSQGNRVVARGNVEIFYNNNILTADEVVYDRNANTLTAAGNVTLKEPNGNVVRADRYTLTDDFRDGFVQSLSIVARDDTRISADRAVRRDGNTNEFVNGRFTPARAKAACRPCGASAPHASSTTRRRQRSPTRTRSSRSSASPCSTCPTSSTPTPR